jgi:hypothetical protein
MHEDWLQRYIKEHYQQLGFTGIHGPYKYGADFKGVYAGKPVKIEAEWDYTDYISHQHSLEFADILVVATLEPVPEHLKERLPSIIMNLDRAKVIEWAQPRSLKKNKDDYHAYAWRRFSRSLLEIYTYYRKHSQQPPDFRGAGLAHSINRSQTPAGFQFGPGGKEESFNGPEEDKAAWDYWLIVAHAVANHFNLKPALLRLTWLDRIALYFRHSGRITDSDFQRIQEVAVYIDELLQRGEV